ncbi:MAG: AAA family ATPase, partial [Actinomycetota bacterium]|nr:AAA family ATPase [Actinomycetota bacterium]
MHLKSLTLKGFKSFASATTLRFEPGITCVVGPNGSGKSNVVDALSWVMGEQGAKALRGGKMEDVIFAGTADRPPLGRAEVTLTIDNSDGALPIDYTEVSVTRRMFRDGASEYEINGSSCRLLDVQELLSDSGIGREMHVIVGQGKLDSILQSKPEERRAFIEEAAGVLKHRKRKEKALRKLDAMQANLNRLTDLTAELAAAQDTWYQLSALAERLRGTAQLAAQRARHLSTPIETHRPGRDPDELEREAQEAQFKETELHAVVDQARAVLSAALDRRVELERAAADAERAHLAAVRAIADRREGLARLAGQVEALRSTTGATADEIDRLSS